MREHVEVLLTSNKRSEVGFLVRRSVLIPIGALVKLFGKDKMSKMRKAQRTSNGLTPSKNYRFQFQFSGRGGYRGVQVGRFLTCFFIFLLEIIIVCRPVFRAQL